MEKERVGRECRRDGEHGLWGELRRGGIPRGAVGVPQSRHGLRSHAGVARSGTGVTLPMPLSLERGLVGPWVQRTLSPHTPVGLTLRPAPCCVGNSPLPRDLGPVEAKTPSILQTARLRCQLCPAWPQPKAAGPPRLTRRPGKGRTSDAGPRRSRQPLNRLLPARGGSWPGGNPAGKRRRAVSALATQAGRGLREGACIRTRRSCDWAELRTPVPVNVTLFGNEVFADVT